MVITTTHKDHVFHRSRQISVSDTTRCAQGYQTLFPAGIEGCGLRDFIKSTTVFYDNYIITVNRMWNWKAKPVLLLSIHVQLFLVFW